MAYPIAAGFTYRAHQRRTAVRPISPKPSCPSPPLPLFPLPDPVTSPSPPRHRHRRRLAARSPEPFILDSPPSIIVAGYSVAPPAPCCRPGDPAEPARTCLATRCVVAASFLRPSTPQVVASIVQSPGLWHQRPSALPCPWPIHPGYCCPWPSAMPSASAVVKCLAGHCAHRSLSRVEPVTVHRGHFGTVPIFLRSMTP
ncbi:hypothetical protein NL676_026016 [Syzygium grande]|nr:hypothetical protein NL676_026016 [Syzygium grande]